MKKSNNTTAYILLGVAAFMYFNYQRRQQVVTSAPVQPGKAGWTQQVAQVVNAAGGLLDSLFGPGGPFEKLSKSQVQAALQQEGWAGPGTGPNDTTGMAGLPLPGGTSGVV